MSVLRHSKRLLWALPTLFGVLVVVFVLLRVAPGDPIAMMVGPGATPDDVLRLRQRYGLDGSIAQQFVPSGRGKAFAAQHAGRTAALRH